MRRNPIAKAWGGEGTITIETDGTVSYFYGITGNNSGLDGTTSQGISTIQPIPIGKWTHLALVRDLDVLKLQWFINGELDNEDAALFPAATAGANPLLIGQGYVENILGDMDEVRIWNVARTGPQIRTQMSDRLTGTETGLVAYWNFDTGFGSLLHDRGANGLDAPLGNGNPTAYPQWIPDVPFGTFTTAEDTDLVLTLTGSDADGDALDALISRLPAHGTLFQTPDGISRGDPVTGDFARGFDGTNDLVTIAENPAGDLTSQAQWSITAWIRPYSSGASFPVIYAEGKWNVSLGLDGGTGHLDSWINDTAQITSDRPVQFGVWQHVALVYDGTERRFYIDGTPAGSGSAPAVSVDTRGAAIGGVITEPDNARNRFHGDIDAVALWELALSDTDLQELARTPINGSENGLLAWWPFNETSGDHVADATGNGSDGVLGGGVDDRIPDRLLNDAPAFADRLPVVSNPEAKIIYAPAEDFNGVDLFLYRVHDGKVSSADGNMLIEVTPANDLPVANDDVVRAVEGFAQSIGNVLGNDTDVEGEEAVDAAHPF